MIFQSIELINKACKDIDNALANKDVVAAKHYLQVIRGLARTNTEKDLITKYSQLIMAMMAKETR